MCGCFCADARHAQAAWDDEKKNVKYVRFCLVRLVLFSTYIDIYFLNHHFVTPTFWRAICLHFICIFIYCYYIGIFWDLRDFIWLLYVVIIMIFNIGRICFFCIYIFFKKNHEIWQRLNFPELLLRKSFIQGWLVDVHLNTCVWPKTICIYFFSLTSRKLLDLLY